MSNSKLAVIAFGGNALLKSHQKGTYSEQIEMSASDVEIRLPYGDWSRKRPASGKCHVAT